MNDESVFHFIRELTRRESVSCVLIGGFAVNHYKVGRQTADVDFLITKEDFDKISSFLEKAGYQKISTEDHFAQFRCNRIFLMDIDFMFVDQGTFKKVVSSWTPPESVMTKSASRESFRKSR